MSPSHWDHVPVAKSEWGVGLSAWLRSVGQGVRGALLRTDAGHPARRDTQGGFMSAELDRQRRVLPLPGEAAIGARPMTSWPSVATREGRVLSRSSPSTPFLGEAFLPAPDVGLGLARPVPNLDRAEAARRK